MGFLKTLGEIGKGAALGVGEGLPYIARGMERRTEREREERLLEEEREHQEEVVASGREFQTGLLERQRETDERNLLFTQMGNITTSEGLAPYVKRYGSDPEYASFIDAKRTDIGAKESQDLIRTAYATTMSKLTDEARYNVSMNLVEKVAGGMPANEAMMGALDVDPNDPGGAIRWAAKKAEEDAGIDTVLTELKKAAWYTLQDPNTDPETQKTLMLRVAKIHKDAGRGAEASVWESMVDMPITPRSGESRIMEIFRDLIQVEMDSGDPARWPIKGEGYAKLKSMAAQIFAYGSEGYDPAAAQQRVAERLVGLSPTQRQSELVGWSQEAKANILEMVTALEEAKKAGQQKPATPTQPTALPGGRRPSAGHALKEWLDSAEKGRVRKGRGFSGRRRRKLPARSEGERVDFLGRPA